MSNAFYIACLKADGHFCKNGFFKLQGLPDERNIKGRRTYAACTAGTGLRFLRRCEKIYKSASKALADGDRKGRKPGNNAARGIVYEMELCGMGLERYPF